MVVALVAVGVLVLGVAVAELAGPVCLSTGRKLAADARPPIVVGLLHSLTGPLGPL